MNVGASEVQGERRAELARALMSRSLHSPSQLVCGGKGRHKKNIPDGLECFGNSLGINWEKLLHFYLRQIGFS